MALVEEGIKMRLEAVAGVTSIVGTGADARIWPNISPQERTLPAVVFRKIGEQRDPAMGVDTPIRRARFEFACFAETYTAAKQLAEQIGLAMVRYRGTLSGVTFHDCFFLSEVDLYDGAVKTHHVHIDIDIAYQV